MTTFVWIFALALAATTTNAFSIHPSLGTPRTSTTRRFLEDHIANMIDNELYRQSHKKESQEQWMEKNRGAMMHFLGKHEEDSMDQDVMMEPERDFRQQVKDARLAAQDPQRYCADRCIATGNCEVYEDFFELSAKEVLEFCENCVMSDGEEPCDVPEAFYEHSLADLKP